MRVVIMIELLVFIGFIVANNLFRRFRGSWKNVLGDFPIHPLLFGAGKFSMGTSWVFLFVQAAGRRLNPFPMYPPLGYASAVLLLLGIAFVIPSFVRLGNESRFGVSEESSGLRTMGVFRVSRNPMYVGFYFVTLASLVFVPHPVNIGCGLVGIYVHHLIVLAEERFLLEKYGASYEYYKHKVRRYL